MIVSKSTPMFIAVLLTTAKIENNLMDTYDG